MKVKRWIQSTIGLSSSEANAMMVLLPSIFVIIFSEPFYRWYLRPATTSDIKEERFLDSLVSQIKPTLVSTASEIVFFNFDPNVSSLEDLRKLGISETVGKRIVQYRTKGGQFRIKSDLAKMYGLDSELYQSLAPFILLPDKIEKKEVKIEIEPTETFIQYDLNLTDTTSLKTIKGIGSTLSKRILKYRDGLGGFIRLEQLKEVYGLDSATVTGMNRFFISDSFQPLKIKINTATESELFDHPYLSSREAKSIITYRLQHGKFSSINDLMKIKTIKESVTARIAPYLSFE